MIPKSGDILVVKIPFATAAGVEYEYGDRLELIEPTGQSPFGHNSAISNWVVKCKHFSPPAPQSVWASIWGLLEYRFLEILPREDD